MHVRAAYLAGLWILVSSISTHAIASDRRLVEAAKGQDWESVRTLLKGRIDVNVPEPDGAQARHRLSQR